METVPMEMLGRTVLELFSEAYEGPRHPYTWFINDEPNSGLLGTVADLSAEDASRALVPGGRTIAAHVEHLRWSLALANAYLRGENPQPKWSESWSVDTVDAAGWNRLRADVRSEYQVLRQAVESPAKWTADAESFTGTLALIPHAAYHLGAIRQVVRALRG